MRISKETLLRANGVNKLRGNIATQASKINDAASDFEAQFISQMLSNMFSTVDAEESLGGSDTEEIFKSMMINEYGKIITRTGGIGVADQVKQMMLKQQEVGESHA